LLSLRKARLKKQFHRTNLSFAARTRSAAM
jgi:hypothetical protein